jgi:hypothetical protein
MVRTYLDNASRAGALAFGKTASPMAFARRFNPQE